MDVACEGSPMAILLAWMLGTGVIFSQEMTMEFHCRDVSQGGDPVHILLTLTSPIVRFARVSCNEVGLQES